MECNKRLLFQILILLLSIFAVGYFLALVFYIGVVFPESSPSWRFYSFFITLAPIMAIIGAAQANNHVIYFNMVINIVLLTPLFIWLLFVIVTVAFFVENDKQLNANIAKLVMIGIPCVLFALIGYLEYLFYSYLKRKEDIDEKLKNIEEATHF